MTASSDLDYVERLHAVVDEAVKPVEKANAARLQCKAGCADCCIDDLTVFEIEAAVIQRHHAELLANEMPHAPGSCAFLDEKRQCRIYAHRPYVCRTQGLPLRWSSSSSGLRPDTPTPPFTSSEARAREDAPGGAPLELRDICPLNVEGGPPIEELPADQCWTLGPIEQRLADRQRDQKRVALRSLFAKSLDDRRRLPTIK